MHQAQSSYGKLCSLFYDATKQYASSEEVAFYAQFMRKEQRILEAMCGSGRLLIPLNQLGFTVDGVDNSHAMLARCTDRLQERSIHADIYEQSLEQLTLPHLYGTVTIALGSFQLITDRAQALAALKQLASVMTPGADLLIDTFVPPKGTGNSSKAVRLGDQEVLTLTTQYTYHDEAQRAAAVCTYELFVDGVATETEQELIQVTWYTDDEFKDLLTSAGFEFKELHKETFPVTGPCCIVHAKKAGT